MADLDRQNSQLRETQRQLEDYRDRYVDLYDSAPLGYVSLDEEGYIQEMNLAGAKLLGGDRSTLTGYPFVDYVAKDDASTFLEHVRRCIQQRAEMTSEVRLVAGDGSQKTVHLRSLPVVDATHDIVLCKTAFADITASKQVEEALRESEARHRAILEASVDGVITINDRGIIESVNPATQRQFGYSPAELIGSNVSILMPSPHRQNHDTYLANYRQTGQRKIIGIGREVVGQRKDGSVFPMDLSVSEVIVDVTDRKTAEEALRKARDELEIRVRERTAELSAAKEAAQEANRAKSAFFWPP
jgi:PAS domain S-box-containing protein